MSSDMTDTHWAPIARRRSNCLIYYIFFYQQGKNCLQFSSAIAKQVFFIVIINHVVLDMLDKKLKKSNVKKWENQDQYGSPGVNNRTIEDLYSWGKCFIWHILVESLSPSSLKLVDVAADLTWDHSLHVFYMKVHFWKVFALFLCETFLSHPI